MKEYNQKLKTLYEKLYTEEAKEYAYKYKENAQIFYERLIEQLEEAYESKKKIKELIEE